MSLNAVQPGSKAPEEFNTIIEIPAQSDPVKYEVDKDTGAVTVDRFVGTGMRYPVNYGFVPHTIAGDGDPVDVLVITPFPLVHGCVIKCRPIGILNMEDDGGLDGKVLALPVEKLSPAQAHITSYDQLPEQELRLIEHFFTQYKALEKGKWVKLGGWGDVAAAKKEISDGIANVANATHG